MTWPGRSLVEALDCRRHRRRPRRHALPAAVGDRPGADRGVGGPARGASAPPRPRDAAHARSPRPRRPTIPGLGSLYRGGRDPSRHGPGQDGGLRRLHAGRHRHGAHAGVRRAGGRRAVTRRARRGLRRRDLGRLRHLRRAATAPSSSSIPRSASASGRRCPPTPSPARAYANGAAARLGRDAHLRRLRRQRHAAGHRRAGQPDGAINLTAIATPMAAPRAGHAVAAAHFPDGDGAILFGGLAAGLDRPGRRAARGPDVRRLRRRPAPRTATAPPPRRMPNGDVLILGGTDDGRRGPQRHRHHADHPGADGDAAADALSAPRAGHTATLTGNDLVVCGGADAAGTVQRQLRHPRHHHLRAQATVPLAHAAPGQSSRSCSRPATSSSPAASAPTAPRSRRSRSIRRSAPCRSCPTSPSTSSASPSASSARRWSACGWRARSSCARSSRRWRRSAASASSALERLGKRIVFALERRAVPRRCTSWSPGACRWSAGAGAEDPRQGRAGRVRLLVGHADPDRGVVEEARLAARGARAGGAGRARPRRPRAARRRRTTRSREAVTAREPHAQAHAHRSAPLLAASATPTPTRSCTARKLSPVALTQRLDERGDRAAARGDRSRCCGEWTDKLRAESATKFPEKVTAFRDEIAVHGKYRQPCPVCGKPVQRIRYAENETNYCAALPDRRQAARRSRAVAAAARRLAAVARRDGRAQGLSACGDGTRSRRLGSTGRRRESTRAGGETGPPCSRTTTPATKSTSVTRLRVRPRRGNAQRRQHAEGAEGQEAAARRRK